MGSGKEGAVSNSIAPPRGLASDCHQVAKIAMSRNLHYNARVPKRSPALPARELAGGTRS